MRPNPKNNCVTFSDHVDPYECYKTLPTSTMVIDRLRNLETTKEQLAVAQLIRRIRIDYLSPNNLNSGIVLKSSLEFIVEITFARYLKYGMINEY